MARLCLVALLLLLGACSTVRITDTVPSAAGGEATKSYKYFGFVKVVVPEAQKDIDAFRIRSAGIALEDGISIGWREREQILVPLKVNEDGSTPDEATCSLVVIIRSAAEAAQAAKALQSIVGENICKVEFQ